MNCHIFPKTLPISRKLNKRKKIKTYTVAKNSGFGTDTVVKQEKYKAYFATLLWISSVTFKGPGAYRRQSRKAFAFQKIAKFVSRKSYQFFYF